MSKLLIDESPLLVLPSLASKIGLNEAIFLQQVHYFLANAKTEAFGEKWIYNTAEDWTKHFPFWSVKTIRRIITSLRDKNLIQTAQHLTGNKFDNKLFYKINYVELSAIEQVDVDKVTTYRDGQNDSPDVDKVTTCLHKNTLQENTQQNTKDISTHITIKTLVDDYGIDEQVANDWFTVRKDKGAKKLTLTSWQQIQKEANKAGLSIPIAIKTCVINEWRGFKADWYANLQGKQQNASQGQKYSFLDEMRKAREQMGIIEDGSSLFLLNGVNYD